MFWLHLHITQFNQMARQTWLSAIISTHQYLLWWSENCKNPSRCLSKGCPWAEYFMRWTFGPQQSAELQQQHQQQGYAWYRRSRRRWPLGQKVSALPNRWPDSILMLLTTFSPKRAKLFLCPSDAPSYVCWTLLRLIKHFMLTWHFLQGVAVTLFWLRHFPG